MIRILLICDLIYILMTDSKIIMRKIMTMMMKELHHIYFKMGEWWFFKVILTSLGGMGVMANLSLVAIILIKRPLRRCWLIKKIVLLYVRLLCCCQNVISAIVIIG